MENPFYLAPEEIAVERARPNSHALRAIAVVREFVERVTHWKEGGTARSDALLALDEAYDDIDWIEHGIVEWRDEALAVRDKLVAARAETEKIRGWWNDAEQQAGRLQRERDKANSNLEVVKAENLAMRQVFSEAGATFDVSYVRRLVGAERDLEDLRAALVMANARADAGWRMASELLRENLTRNNTPKRGVYD